MRIAVAVPVKSFTGAKARLAPVLSPATRALLARLSAERVLDAVRDWSPHVVCDDPDVAEWARSRGVAVVPDTSADLNGAVRTAMDAARSNGFDHLAVVHADLVRPDSLGALLRSATSGAVTLVPDIKGDGTNVAIIPLDVGWLPRYGAGSFDRHLRAAIASRLALSVVRDRDLALDVDHPADLRHPLVAPAVEALLAGATTDTRPPADCRAPGKDHDQR